MGKPNNEKKIKTYDIDYNKANEVVFFMYTILIILPLMFRGGYFEKELFPILIGLNILFVIWLFIQRKNNEFKIFSNPIEILFFGIVIMYLLSILYGVDKRGSIVESIKYFSYFATIVLGINLAKDRRYEKGILDTIIIASVIVSIIGIGAAIGTWDYLGAYSGTRISSTFQYPNTLAAYVAAIYFLTLTMLINTNNRLKKAIYGMVLGILIFTFILTYSRAMWLMFPISIILYFALIPNSRKLETLIYMIISVIISVPASFLFTRGVTDPSNELWLIFIVPAIGTGLLIKVFSLLDNRFRVASIKKLIIIITGLFILVVALGVYAINSTTEITLNNESNEDKWTNLNRNIIAVQPSTDYLLKLKYTGENSSEAPYLGRVLVYNISDSDEIIQLAVENIVENGEGAYEIPFTTDENSVGVRVSFQNVYTGTSFTIKESSISEVDDVNLIKIPLKYKYIPESIVSRFNSITAGETSLTRRITFNKDGLDIIKDYPILGTGGEGWRTLYQSYQSEPYISNLAHNYFVQLCIEIGFVGLLLVLGILVSLTIFLLNTFRKSDDDNFKSTLVGLFVTMFTMLLHAFVDFDMSLSGYAIIVWVIVGLLSSNLCFNSSRFGKIKSTISNVSKKTYIYGLSIIAVSIVYTTGSFVLGDIYAQKAVDANELNDVEQAMLNFEKAVRYDGYESTYRIDLSKLYMNLYSASDNVEYASKAIEQVEEYIRLSPYNAQVVSNASSFYFSIGEIDKGVEYLEKALELQPLKTEAYIQKLDGYFAVYEYYYYEGKDRSAKKALEDSLTVKGKIAEVNARSEKPINENVELVYKIGRAQFYLENFDRLMDIAGRDLVLDFAYYFDVDANSDGNPDMLYVSKPEGSNIDYENFEGEEGFVRISNDSEIMGFIYPYGIKLQPDTSYVVEINARGNANPETFSTYAWSNGSVEPNQGGLNGISLSEEWGTYAFEFTTDSDVVSGQQYIMLQHMGNDKGYIDIKDIVIFEVNN